jgi:4,5-dihydroxyphthalate decarboxylase
MRQPLSLACWDYDRTLALADGRVTVKGADLNYLVLPVEETFFRMTRYAEFDAAEMSLSSYVMTLERDGPFVAIPVFPSRAFRHNSIYINSSSGIEHPEDLRGRVVGVPEYQVTAAVWIRGILAEQHGVPVESVRYRTGGLHSPGRTEKLGISPPGVDIEPIAPDQTLAQMLVTGQIDALYTPRVPQPFTDRHPSVRRLWADPRAAETAYFRCTGIFPIMHAVVLRRDVYEKNRWLAGSLFEAFSAAKQVVTSRLEETAALVDLLPWSYAEARLTRDIMGEDFWPYGLGPNEHVLRTFLRYSQQQGLIRHTYTPSDLFAPETHEFYVI